ncbi:MAG: hypothetical protein ABIN96_17335 [Rubrivivax sp.]
MPDRLTAVHLPAPDGRSLHAGLVRAVPALVTLLLALPLVAPALHGVAAAAVAASGWDADALANPLWPNARVQLMLLRGVLLGLGSALLATAAGAAVAVALLLPLPLRWRIALGALLAASFCFGSVVHLMAWRTLFPGVTGGAGGWALAILTLGGRYMPLCAALFATGLLTLDRSELESALFAGGGRAVWAVARGRLWRLGGISVAAVAALVFSETELPPLLGVYIYAEEFMSLVALESSSGAAAAQGWPLMVVALLGGAVLSRLPRLRPASGSGQASGWLGAWVFAPVNLRRLAVPLALTLAILPLVLLALGTWQATGRWQAVSGRMLSQTLFNTLAVGAVASAWAGLWGWALAAWAARSGRWAVTALHLLLPTLMLWPSSLTGLAVLALSTSAWPVLDVVAEAPLVTAHFLRILPFTAWLMLAMREAEPPAPREQLMVLGASTWGTLRHVHGPAALPRLAAAFMLGLGLSLAELTATVLTVPPGMETVILRLYNLLHYGDQRGVMSLALVQGVLVAAIVALALGGMQLWRARRHA